MGLAAAGGIALLSVVLQIAVGPAMKPDKPAAHAPGAHEAHERH
jgi:hypothetical protein